MYKHLFIIANFRKDIIKKIRIEYPDSCVLIWDDNQVDEKAYRWAVKFGEIIIVEDRIFKAIQWGKPVSLLSKYMPQLESRSSSTASGNNFENSSAGKGKQLFHSRKPVVFCPSNDTHVMMFAPIHRFISGSRFMLFDLRPNERAEELLKAAGIPYDFGDYWKIARLNSSVIVVGNDWNKRFRDLLDIAHLLRIPTVCIQEGCLDFDTNHRMQQCTYPFIQGPLMLTHLNQESFFMTGNPRFDNLKPLPLPEKPLIMVNCNFTYNIHEDKRDGWIQDVAEACKTVGVDFFISQHPRDTGHFPDLPVKKSSADVINQQLESSTGLITRFSTTVYEAMLMGRQVIYYNPHREAMRLFNEDETGGIYKAYNQDDLVQAIRLLLNPITNEQKQKFNQFLELHCGTNDGNAAYRCASALKLISEQGYPLPISDTLMFLKSRFERKIRYVLKHQ